MIRKLVKSMSYAFIAQVVSLTVSVFMSFYVSKFMSVTEYGYYQFFLFCSTYTPLIQLGVSEGVYLKYGGKKYLELDFLSLRNLFINVLLIVNIVLLVGGTAFFFITVDKSKKIILLLICIYSIANFFVSFFGMLLQSVNRTEDYSKAIIVGKIITLISFIILIIMKNYQFFYYCFIFLLGHAISGIIVTVCCKEIICCKGKWQGKIAGYRTIIISGMSLLLSGLVSSFIVGINRIYIEKYMGITIFGKVSMSLSLVNFIILFAIQVGMVMFPRLAQASDDQKVSVYKSLDNYITYLMPLTLLAYIPIKFVLSLWIPQYEESIAWMLLLMPYMIYEIRTQIMYNTYYKALRKEKILFLINLSALILCAVVNLIVIIKYKNVEYVFCVINLIMIIKSLVLSWYLEKVYKINIKWKSIVEALVCYTSSLVCYHSHNGVVIFIVFLIYVSILFLYSVFIHCTKKSLINEDRNRWG